MTLDRVENRNLLVHKNVLGLFSWQKIYLSSFSKFEQKTCQRFGETFPAWPSELNSRCPEEHFDAQQFLEKSDFYCQFGILSDNIMQLLATWVSACQSEMHSTLPEKLFEGNKFWTTVNMWSVIEINQKSFARIIKTAFYISSGQLWRKVHFLGKIIFKVLLPLFEWYFIGTLTNENGSTVKWAYLASGQKCWGKTGFLEKYSKFSYFLEFEQKTTGKNVKPAFQLSSEAIWRNLKFLQDLWINIIFGLRVIN